MESPPRLKERQSRARKPKVHSGCDTCKLRHVKCDETKPSCRRCQLGRQECRYATLKFGGRPLIRRGFLPIQSRVSATEEHMDSKGTGLPEIQNRSSQLLIYTPSASIPGDCEERRHFQLFVERVALDLSGYFHTPFWTRLILQECHREPAIRHEVCALSALYKVSISQTCERKSHLLYALVQQSKALRCLRKRLSTRSVRLALIASLIFGSFQSLEGNVENAVQQLSSATRLLDRWKNEKVNVEKQTNHRPPANSAQHSEYVDPDLIGVVERLELPLLSFVAMNPVAELAFDRAKRVDEIGKISIPDRILSVQQGLPSALQFCKLSLVHMRKCNAYKICQRPLALHCSFVQNQNALMTMSSHWKVAFAPVFQGINNSVLNFECLGALLYDVYVRVFENIVMTSLSTDETVYDEYNDTFQGIINSSREVLQKDHNLRIAARQHDITRALVADSYKIGPKIPILQISLGVIPDLFYSATRCREPFIRRQAIALLRKWKGLNGVWDSIHAATVAEWVVSIEEASITLEKGAFVGEGVCMDFVKEEWRVRMHTLKWNFDTNKDEIIVECFQGAGNGKGILHKATLPCQSH